MAQPTRRSGPSPPDAFREIRVGERKTSSRALGSGGQTYPSNVIVTSKYTVLNFFPKNLWEQMHKAANLYFFLISMVMAVGNFTPLFRGTINFAATFFTLVIMMAVSAVIAAFDDKARHTADRHTNNQPARRIVQWPSDDEDLLETIPWRDVQVGDMLVVKSEEEFPADLIPLTSSSGEGTCYVSTANLDGETNLKVKSATAKTHALLSEGASADGDNFPMLTRAVRACRNLDGKLKFEPPQKSIHNFQGTIKLKVRQESSSGDNKEEPLGPQQILLRGTQLRNTAWVLGVVVYTGPETRMAQNSRAAPSKTANIERSINRVMMVVVGTQALLALICDIAYCITKSHFEDLWYLEFRNILLPSWIASWFTFFVLFSNLMPISLYATMEFCNFAQAYFIHSDLDMYDDDQDCPAKARATNLGHELGQVAYIFSDKTGTLTQNVMELKQVSINGQIFGKMGGERGFHGGPELAEAKRKDRKMAQAINEFFELLAVAHTVVATTDQNGNLSYEAESPDEGALVEASADVGWKFVGRKAETMYVEVTDSSDKAAYTILALNAFSSARKRQSVVVGKPGGEKWLYVKGADTVMLDRAASVDTNINDHLQNFAEQGLRTLILGSRKLSNGEFQTFLDRYNKAQTSMEHRESDLADAAESIEKDLNILGISAIEDKLQDGVPESIKKIRAAGIKLWVLTGDKLETARNIGFSAGVLSSEMEILVLEGSRGEGSAVARRAEGMVDTCDDAVSNGRTVALLVTGQAIEEITSCQSEQDFLQLAANCAVVIACRVSPSQKAQMVRLVRKGVHPSPVTLAIGDGANDVPMIQEAQVGVGISGREGKQAVNSADFGIAQFRYIQRLLLVHGRWNYRRAAKFTLYSFWKNSVLVMLMFYYNFISGNTGTSLFENWVRASYNIILAAPIISVGIFDRDVEAKDAIEHPELYDTGRRGMDLNTMKLVETLLSSMVHSVVMMVMMALALPHFTEDGVGDYYTFGTAIFVWLVITMNYRVAFLTTTWNILVITGLAISFGLLLLFLGIYCFVQWGIQSFSPWMYFVPAKMVMVPVFWIGCFVAPALATVIDIFKAYLLLEFAPDLRDLILERSAADQKPQEADRLNRFGSYATFQEFSHSQPPSPVFLEAQRRAGRSSTHPPVAWSSFVWDHPDRRSRTFGDICSMTRDPTAGDTSLMDRSRSFPTGELGPLSPAADSRRGGRKRTEASSSSSSGDAESGGAAGSAVQPKENRPSANRLSQQTLPSKQFVLTWRVTLGLTIGLGVCFFVLGAIFHLTPNVPNVQFQYDGASQATPEGFKVLESSDCSISEVGGTTKCRFEVMLEDSLVPPVRVDYLISPFFQNHAMYLQSYSWRELQGHLHSTNDCAETVLDDGLHLFPCGLQSRSLFNDTFVFRDAATQKILELTKDDVAWKTDVARMSNPKGYPTPREGLTWLYEAFPSIISRDLGVKTEAFAAWSRPAFGPMTQKTYGRLEEALEAGQRLVIEVENSFPITDMQAHKRLIFSPAGTFYHRTKGFGHFMCVAGGICFILAAIVLIVRCSCARQPGQARRRCVAVVSGLDSDVDSVPTSSSEASDSSGHDH